MNTKRIVGAALASTILFAPFVGQTTAVAADSFYTNQTNAERADITNWVANTSEQIGNNISAQHINLNDLNGSTYVIQWGDTLSGISTATGISVRKLAYDNNIENIDLIYAGDTLVLNRSGYVPTGWTYDGDGTRVANTKVTINNFVDNSDHSVTINVSPVAPSGEGTSDDSSSSSTDYSAPSGSSASGESADDSDTSNDTTTSDSMDSDEFSDAVSEKLADKLGLSEDDADKLSIDFTSSSDDEDTESDDTDSDTQTVYDEDQTVSLKNDKLTQKNAKKLANKIYKQLDEDGKTADITDADEIEVTITEDGSDYNFNVTLTTESDEDSDSDTTDSESDSTESDSTDEDTTDDETSTQSDDQETDSQEDNQNATTSDEDTDTTDSDY